MCACASEQFKGHKQSVLQRLNKFTKRQTEVKRETVPTGTISNSERPGRLRSNAAPPCPIVARGLVV